MTLDDLDDLEDLDEVFALSDRIAVLYEGRIIFTGTVDEVKGTTDPYVRQFIEGRSQGPIPLR